MFIIIIIIIIIIIFSYRTANFSTDYLETYVKFVRKISNLRTVAIFVAVTLQTTYTRNFLLPGFTLSITC